ncbi:hypothetical protein, partial [Vreelandella olivaria]|uniref:hypothetical protein n=1 Tax=Vreelandella olivaria TaxID=390919 RepID=UPI00201F2DC5
MLLTKVTDQTGRPQGFQKQCLFNERRRSTQRIEADGSQPHTLTATGLDLEIALEPDALHRETQRRFRLGTHAPTRPLLLERGYTALGQ